MKKFGLVLSFLCSIVLMFVGISAICPHIIGINLVQTEYSEPIEEKNDNIYLESCGPIYDGINLDRFNLDKSVRAGLNALFCNNFYAWSLIFIFFLSGFSWFIGLILRCINGKIGISFVYSSLIGIFITLVSIWDIVLSLMRGERFGGDIFMLLIGIIFLVIGFVSFVKYCRCATLKYGRPVYAKVVKYTPVKLYNVPTTSVDMDDFLNYGLSSLTTEKCYITFDDGVSLFEDCFSGSIAPEIKSGGYLPIYFSKDKSSYWIDYNGFKKREPANYLQKNLNFYGLDASPLRKKLHLLSKKGVGYDLFIILLLLVFGGLLVFLGFTGDKSWYSGSNFFSVIFGIILLVSILSIGMKTVQKYKLNRKIKRLKELTGKYLKISSIVENERILGNFRSYYVIVSDGNKSYRSENFSTNNIHDLLMVGDSVMFYKDDSDEYYIDVEDCEPSKKFDPFVANEEQYDEKEKMDKKINKMKGAVGTVISDVQFAKKIMKK